MQFHPSYHLSGASFLTLDVGYLFLVGSNILLLTVVQQRAVILELSQEDEHTSFYSTIFTGEKWWVVSRTHLDPFVTYLGKQTVIGWVLVT